MVINALSFDGLRCATVSVLTEAFGLLFGPNASCFLATISALVPTLFVASMASRHDDPVLYQEAAARGESTLPGLQPLWQLAFVHVLAPFPFTFVTTAFLWAVYVCLRYIILEPSPTQKEYERLQRAVYVKELERLQRRGQQADTPYVDLIAQHEDDKCRAARAARRAHEQGKKQAARARHEAAEAQKQQAKEEQRAARAQEVAKQAERDAAAARKQAEAEAEKRAANAAEARRRAEQKKVKEEQERLAKEAEAEEKRRIELEAAKMAEEQERERAAERERVKAERERLKAERRAQKEVDETARAAKAARAAVEAKARRERKRVELERKEREKEQRRVQQALKKQQDAEAKRAGEAAAAVAAAVAATAAAAMAAKAEAVAVAEATAVAESAAEAAECVEMAEAAEAAALAKAAAVAEAVAVAEAAKEARQDGYHAARARSAAAYSGSTKQAVPSTEAGLAKPAGNEQMASATEGPAVLTEDAPLPPSGVLVSLGQISISAVLRIGELNESTGMPYHIVMPTELTVADQQPLLLFDCDRRELHGVFSAVGGRSADGIVRFRPVVHFAPLAESACRGLLQWDEPDLPSPKVAPAAMKQLFQAFSLAATPPSTPKASKPDSGSSTAEVDSPSGVIGPPSPAGRAAMASRGAGRGSRGAGRGGRGGGMASPPAAVSSAATTQAETELSLECVVCLSAPSTHIFVPCGHQCCCEVCAKKVMEASTEEACPYCRSPCSFVMRVHAV